MLDNIVLEEELFIRHRHKHTENKITSYPKYTHKVKLDHAIILRTGKTLEFFNLIFEFQPKGGMFFFLVVCLLI